MFAHRTTLTKRTKKRRPRTPTSKNLATSRNKKSSRPSICSTPVDPEQSKPRNSKWP